VGRPSTRARRRAGLIRAGGICLPFGMAVTLGGDRLHEVVTIYRPMHKDGSVVRERFMLGGRTRKRRIGAR
jgi:hypothetical protein